MPEIPAEKRWGSHSSRVALSLSPFWSQISKNDICLHNSPFHNTFLTTAPVWATLDHSLLHSNSLAAQYWGKVPRREYFPQYLLVEPPYSHLLGVKLRAKHSPKEETLWASKTGRDITTHGIPAWKEWGEPSTEPTVLHKTSPWLSEAPVGWYKQQHTMLTKNEQPGIFTRYSIPQSLCCTEGFCSTEQLVWEG